MSNSYSSMFEAALADFLTDERVRAIEGGAPGGGLWLEVDSLGYADALVPEDLGGAGLSLAQAAPLLCAAGRAGLNHPLGETMVARALLALAGWKNDGACVALAPAVAARRGEAVACAQVPGALLATHVLVDAGERWLLMPVASARVAAGIYRLHVSASLAWDSDGLASFQFAKGEGHCARSLCNAIHASAMAGAMERVLELCVQYANDRRQFGRAIGQFQAVQQDLAVLAQQVGMSALAARMGCATAGLHPDPLLAASAKLNASDAALRVANLAHAVHGAIGITEEHVLGVFTARLHELRAAADTGHACAARLGHALLHGGQQFLDFVRGTLAPAPMEEA